MTGTDDRRRLVVAGGLLSVMLVAATLVAGCSSEDSGAPVEPVPTTLPEDASLTAIGSALGCTETVELGPLTGPIRGGAATAGIACSLPSGSVHLFRRAPAGAPSATGSAMGGLTANIDRLLMTQYAPDPRCPAELVIGTGYFAVSDSLASLATIESVAGHVERSASPAAPMTSYLVAPCHTGLDPLGFP